MKKVIVLLGPTGVGKTNISIRLAQKHNCPIISADSRQFFRGLEIGTAAPTESQLKLVKHHLVGMLDVTDYYSVSQFEQDSVRLAEDILQDSDYTIVTGGSMLYLDAFCNGIDSLPTIDEGLRTELYKQYEQEGLEAIQAQLKILDPTFYNEVDLKNHKRVIHAVEICLMSGKPYSSMRTKKKKKRSFEIIKIGLLRDRTELYSRINERVDHMIQYGLLQEAEIFYPYRHLNSLNTVGYKELFQYLDGEWTLDFAINKIKQNTRIYSRKQMTWFKRDSEISWFNMSSVSEDFIIQEITNIVDI